MHDLWQLNNVLDGVRSRLSPVALVLALICAVLASCASTDPTKVVARATATALPVTQNIYYRTDDQTVTALNATTGAVRWTFSRGQGSNTPVAAGNLVYVQTVGQPDTLYALDSATGAVVWSIAGGTPPVVADGALFVIVDQTLICVDAATGAARWRQQDQNGRVTVIDDILLVVGAKPITFTGAPTTFKMSAIDPVSGAVRWSHTSDQESFTDPIAHDGVVYFASHLVGAAQLNALRLSDGTQI
jgi:outer membrane protein assembly factor BamB